MDYKIPAGVHAIPHDLLDLRPDSAIDQVILNPPPITSEKNIWFFWHQGFACMHPYTQRNVRAYYRRLSPQGWTIRVIDRVEGSPLNVANFLDVNSTDDFPQAFVDGTIGGDYAPQHTSDLVRFPLLFKYGGVYADVGMLQIGDLDRLWNETIGDPKSPYEVISYIMLEDDGRGLTNYFLASDKNNPLFYRSHKLLLKLWEGKSDTEGMHTSPLLGGLKPMGEGFDWTFKEGDRVYPHEEVRKMLSDYIIQGQVIKLVLGLVDEEDGWNGTEYVAKNVYAMEYMEASQLINQMTMWNGLRQFELMSLPLPKEGEVESGDQKLAREFVEACLVKSFGFKLAHGIIIRVMGQTLGSLWRKHEGADDVPGTYGHWLRYGIANWCQDELPKKVDFKVAPPLKTGPLLRER
ncbi:hypothetical protein M409DRAFT_59378 [Zasmidium cellare ATCC 36951]|uniref:Capsule polysaccharide biosynthesis protein n=1 Tax=Zasmidium cellare ATCC 36951 TaxID=1080233 RepID=A0A6A6C2F6_ZASCE|nr:uncharacterized protein M409DRAFT_59378 [Zasmidium cellare ATCC 36951]KAF2161113.1 hypothetical protein M409DRAFT_59378 [Zasmidium cellare ATCC 36951]